MGLTREQLGQLIGYKAQAIYWFERGETPPRKSKGKRRPPTAGKSVHLPVDRAVWLRYKRCCHSVTTREDFKW